MENWFHKYQRKISLFACLIYNILMFAVLIHFGEPVFATNDDYRMRLIVSGAYAGIASNQAVFINTALSSILALLYSICPGIEWYGLFFEGGIFVSVCLTEYIYLKRTEKISSFIGKFVWITVISALIVQKQILLPQFTTVAAFFVMAVICCCIEILTKCQLQEKHIGLYTGIAILFIVLAYVTRRKIFLMACPLLFVIFVVCLWECWRSKEKWIFIRIAVVGSILCGGLWGINQISQSNAEMTAFLDFCEARSGIYDYSGIPEYAENTGFYNSLGIDHAVYNAISARTFDVSPAINAENFEAIREYAEGLEENNLLQKTWQAFEEVMLEYTDPEVVFSFLAGGVLFVVLFMGTCQQYDRKSIILFCAMIGYAVYVVIAFLIIGRMMPRILESILIFLLGFFFAMLSANTAFSGRIHLTIEKKCLVFLKKMVAIVLLLALVLGNEYSLLRDRDYVRATIVSRTMLLQELREYAAERPENFYFYNALEFIAASDYVFRPGITEKSNIESLGNWYAMSPLYYERNEQYGFTTAREGLLKGDNVYYAELSGACSAIRELLEQKGKIMMHVDNIYCNGYEIKIFRAVDMEP